MSSKNAHIRIALTGFMGVGKSSVARHMAGLLRCRRIDLDHFIEEREGRKIADIIDDVGIERFRRLETDCLRIASACDGDCILSLGGGTWTIAANRELIRQNGFQTVWLESSFEHCWYNIKFSPKDRPLARCKEDARKLFDDRQLVYCLADSHFIIRPELNSLDIARQIVEQIA